MYMYMNYRRYMQPVDGKNDKVDSKTYSITCL